MQAKGHTPKHLTKNDRLRMERWLNRGVRPGEIADKLRVHISTVCRELKRGEYKWLDGDTWGVVTAYNPNITEERYQNHLRERGSDSEIGADHELTRYIEETIITSDCSPTAVLGYTKTKGRTFKTSVSVATIYSRIKGGIFLRIIQMNLSQHGKKKQGYKRVKTRKGQARASAGESIERRPERVKNQEEFRHWGMDTVYNKKNNTSKALLILIERKTRREIIILIPNHKTGTIVEALDALGQKIGTVNSRKTFRTITVNNGSEFLAAEEMGRSVVNKTISRTKVYSCHPYPSWEHGGNENANIMIRRKHPKGTGFERVSARQIAEIEQWINNYPRKMLGYISSEVAFRVCLREVESSAQAVWDTQEKGGNRRRHEEHNKGKRGLPTRGIDDSHVVILKLGKTKGEDLCAIDA